MAEPKPVAVDASRGTVVWGFNRFRSDALVQLLNDLLDLERVGLSDEDGTCGQVKNALGKVVNVATAFPDGSWLRGSVWSELSKFEQLYIEWNGHDGPDATGKRKKTLQSMRKRRHRIAKTIRKNQYIIANELDLELIGDIYNALGDLTRALPDLFKNLAQAVGRFTSKAALN
jgi:hypothetical protein